MGSGWAISTVAIGWARNRMVLDAPASGREASMADEKPVDHSPDPSPDLDAERTIELIRRAQSGDGRARETLFDRYGKRLEHWATGRLPYAARDRMDTKDLVQDVLLAALRHFDRFNPLHDGAFPAYMRLTLTRKVIDVARRARRLTAPLDDQASDPGPLPIDVAIGRDLREHYEQALDQLTEAEQNLIFLRLELDLGYQEIAEITGRSNPDSARMAVKRAVLHLAERMPDGRS